MSILDFFDPNNAEHIEAYAQLCRTGVWPNGFISDDITFPHLWNVLLANILAKCWVKHILKNGA